MIKAIIHNLSAVDDDTIADIELFDLKTEKTVGNLKGCIQNFSAQPNDNPFRSGYKLNIEIAVDSVELR